MDITHLPGFFFQTQRFGNWICFRHQVKEERRKVPTHLGPLERASLDAVQYYRRDGMKENEKTDGFSYIQHSTSKLAFSLKRRYLRTGLSVVSQADRDWWATR
jgi:hypothetical protein